MSEPAAKIRIVRTAPITPQVEKFIRTVTDNSLDARRAVGPLRRNLSDPQ